MNAECFSWHSVQSGALEASTDWSATCSLGVCSCQKFYIMVNISPCIAVRTSRFLAPISLSETSQKPNIRLISDVHFQQGFSLSLEQCSSSKNSAACHDSTFIWRNLEHKEIWKEKFLNFKQRYIVNYYQWWKLKENPWLILANNICSPAFCLIWKKWHP